MDKKRGSARWIPIGMTFRGSWQCSNCNSIYKITDDKAYIPGWKFCPNCGCEMERIDRRLMTKV